MMITYDSQATGYDDPQVFCFSKEHFVAWDRAGFSETEPAMNRKVNSQSLCAAAEPFIVLLRKG